jgi:hypothetical protein
MRAIVLGVVLLAANVVAAQAETRQECLRKYEGFIFDKGQTTVERFCDPKNFVTDPNEYGWICDWDIHAIVRAKGQGAKQRRDALCGTE